MNISSGSSVDAAMVPACQLACHTGPIMADTIHHLPGRLRIRMTALHRDACAAARACSLLGTCPGVLQVQASPITGSLLVHYDCRRISGQDLLNVLARGGFAPPREHVGSLPRLVDTAISMAFGKLVERGAACLLAAII